MGDVQASESALLSRVKVLAKRIENTEVLIKRFQTSKGMEGLGNFCCASLTSFLSHEHTSFVPGDSSDAGSFDIQQQIRVGADCNYTVITIAVTPFHMVGVLNHMRKMNVPPFTVKKIQPIVEDEVSVETTCRW